MSEKLITTILFLVLMLFVCPVIAQKTIPQPDPQIEVREGFELTIAQADIQVPRFMEIGPDGTLYVSRPHQGQIKTCTDKDGDGYYETVNTFVSNHRTAHCMFFHDGWLWFTETGAIFKARDIDGDGQADEEVTVIEKGRIPTGGGHWWRSILIHKGRIYTSIGDSGNISDERDTERQKIWSFKLDGSDKKLFASGLRNTEKLVVRPGTDEIWGMDHGSDWFGGVIEEMDDEDEEEEPEEDEEEEEEISEFVQPITDYNPPCEMNHYIEGGFYGHPFIVGSRVPRYEYMNLPEIVELAAKTIPPAWPTGAHWAPNAMEFYTGEQFPEEIKGDAFVAYHGSWNRSRRSGYCLTRVLFDKGRPYGELVYVKFITPEGRVLGRPVDAAVAPDGTLLISDDEGNKIYRLKYVGTK
ncbi:MAG: PQQ-dependent sugar dehydrogenase [Planctomycetota bacterium]|jgi:glucose/arabinose dehydrogenase